MTTACPQGNVEQVHIKCGYCIFARHGKLLNTIMCGTQ